MYPALNLHMPKQNAHQGGITLNTTGVFIERSKRAWDWTVAGFKSVSYSSLKSECNSKITIPSVWLPKRKGGDTLQAYWDLSFRIRLSFIWGLIRFKSLSFITRNTVLSFFQFYVFLWTPICDQKVDLEYFMEASWVVCDVFKQLFRYWRIQRGVKFLSKIISGISQQLDFLKKKREGVRQTVLIKHVMLPTC